MLDTLAISIEDAVFLVRTTPFIGIPAGADITPEPFIAKAHIEGNAIGRQQQEMGFVQSIRAYTIDFVGIDSVDQRFARRRIDLASEVFAKLSDLLRGHAGTQDNIGIASAVAR